MMGSIALDEFSEIGRGRTTFLLQAPVTGKVRWLEADRDVFHLIDEGEMHNTIAICRGETGTLLRAAIDAGVGAVITLQGESHSPLGMLSHESGTPYILDVEFGSDTLSPELPQDGDWLKLDFSNAPIARIEALVNASDVEKPPPTSAFSLGARALRQRDYQGNIPGGSAGDRLMRQRQRTRVLNLDEESLHRELTVDEFNDWSRYAGWNIWDILARPIAPEVTRALPTYKYAGLNNLQVWGQCPEHIRLISDALGPEGVIELGRRSRHEIGSKLNPQHVWLLLFAIGLGRGVGIDLGLVSSSDRQQDILQSLQFSRRLYSGMFGGGVMFASMRNYMIPLLDPSLLRRFDKEKTAIKNQKERKAISRLSAVCHLLSTLVHSESGCGVSASGPYEGQRGERVIVRDYFFQAEPLAHELRTLPAPYSVSVVSYLSSPGYPDLHLADVAKGNVPVDPSEFTLATAVYVKDVWNEATADLSPLKIYEIEDLCLQLEGAVSHQKAQLLGAPEHDVKRPAAYESYAELILPFAREAGLEDAVLNSLSKSPLAPADNAGATALVHFDLANSIVPRLVLSGAGYPEIRADALDSSKKTGG